MSEKAIAIGQYFVASGVYTLFGVTWPTTGSEILTDYLFKGIEEELGGKWDLEKDPEMMAKKMIAHIDLQAQSPGHRQGPGAGPLRHGYAPGNGRSRRLGRALRNEALGQGPGADGPCPSPKPPPQPLKKARSRDRWSRLFFHLILIRNQLVAQASRLCKRG